MRGFCLPLSRWPILATVRFLGRRPPQVEKLKRSGDVDGLCAALRYEDPLTDRDGRFVDLGAEVREAAALALATVNAANAQQALLRALADPEPRVRLAAVRGLRGHGAIVPVLSEAVVCWTASELVEARAGALELLASVGPSDALPSIAAMLVARRDDLDEFDQGAFSRIAHAAGAARRDTTIQELIGKLRDPREARRARALLAWLAPDSVEPLIASLDGAGSRADIAIALGTVRDSRAVEPLCSLLTDSGEPAVRRAAAYALGEIRDSAAITALLVATSDADYSVRAQAIASFDKLGNAAIAVAVSALSQPRTMNGATGAAEVIAPQSAAAELLRRPGATGGLLTGRAAPVFRRLLGRPDDQ